jgi:hypothetical protein
MLDLRLCIADDKRIRFKRGAQSGSLSAMLNQAAPEARRRIMGVVVSWLVLQITDRNNGPTIMGITRGVDVAVELLYSECRNHACPLIQSSGAARSQVRADLSFL